MKTTMLAFIMLMGGCNALFAGDRNPTKLATGVHKTVQVFMLENNAGIIKLKCITEHVKIKISDANGKLVFEKEFKNEPLEINVQNWDEGEYRYDIIANEEVVKSGFLKVNN